MTNKELGKTELQFVQSSRSERARMLDETTWSGNLNWDLIQEISTYMAVYQIEANQLLFEEYAREAYLCVVVSGAVSIIKEDSNNVQKVMHTIGAGKVLGEVALLDGHPRSATVTASKDTTVLIFTQANLAEMIANKPRVAIQFVLKISRALSHRLRQTSGILIDSMDK